MKVKLGILLAYILLLALGVTAAKLKFSLDLRAPAPAAIEIPAPMEPPAMPVSHTAAMLDLNNAFTGNNTHAGLETFSGGVDISTISGSTQCVHADSSGNLTGTGVDCPSGAVSLSNDNTWTNNNRFKGPIPWVDITTYGARAIQTTLGFTQTATIGASSSTATLSTAGPYQNGDYLVILGAGSGNTVGATAPVAPTITPSLATGPLNSGLTAPSAAGSTTYSRKIMWCDVVTESCSAPSLAGTTSTGQATLGRQSLNITSIAASGTIATVTLAAPDVFTTGCTIAAVTCPEVQVWKATDARFTGFALAATAVDSTHFTYYTPGSTTYGASTSATGGQMQYFVGNKVDCGSAPIATAICVVYDGGSGAYLGSGRMGDSYWDDWGSTVSGSMARPWFVPATVPSTFQNNALLTYIVSGAGTTTITLHDAAATAVTSQASSLDMCTDIQNAANAAVGAGSGLRITPTDGTNHYAFVISSFCQLPAYLQIRQAGSLYTTNSIELTGQYNEWIANRDGANNGGGRITYAGLPAFYLTSSYGHSVIDGIYAASVDANGNESILSDQSTYNVLRNSTFSVGTGGASYLGMATVVRGNAFDNLYYNDYMDGAYPNGGSNLGDTTAPNMLFLSSAGQMGAQLEYLNMYAKTIAVIGSTNGLDLRIDHLHDQGPVSPILTTDSTFGLYELSFNRVVIDSTAAPALTLLGANGWLNTATFSFTWGAADTGGFPPITSGGIIKDAQVIGMNQGHPFGQNFDINGGGVGALYSQTNVSATAKMNQSAASNWSGTCTLGTSCVITFGTAYNSTPVCIGTDQTGANAVKSAPGTTGVTFTGTGTDVIAWACFGNPN